MKVVECTPCVKIAFATEAVAWARLFEIALTPTIRRSCPRPIRPYWCQQCFAWHVTRRP